MLSDGEKHVLKALVAGGMRIIRGSSHTVQRAADAPPDMDSGINRTARPGEKVIALAYDDRAGAGESIRHGEILTVESFHLGAYKFRERPACYDPYLGETAAPWHTATSYMLVNDTSKAIVKYLNDVEASTKDCLDEVLRKVKEYKPQRKSGPVFSTKSIELVLSEYEAVVLECAPVFEESIKKQYHVREFIRSLNGAAPDEDVAIHNGSIRGSLQRISDQVKKGILYQYRGVHWMAGKKLQEDVIDQFSTAFGKERRKICDSICDPYMKYIVQSLA